MSSEKLRSWLIENATTIAFGLFTLGGVWYLSQYRLVAVESKTAEQKAEIVEHDKRLKILENFISAQVQVNASLQAMISRHDSVIWDMRASKP